jgi:hypothetical protein
MSMLPFIVVTGSRPLTGALTMFFTIMGHSFGPAIDSALGSTEIGAEAGEELSVEEEETEKGRYNAAINHHG